jgi:DNA invertase Pin-like site-specific DNA recombinase
MQLTAGEHLPRRRLQRDDPQARKRPALDALRDKARLRELEVVVVLSPDRLARNGKFTRWYSSRNSRRVAAGWSSWRGR